MLGVAVGTVFAVLAIGVAFGVAVYVTNVVSDNTDMIVWWQF